MLKNMVVLITGGLGKVGTCLASVIEARGGTPILTSRNVGKVHSFNIRAKEQNRAARAYHFIPRAETDVSVFLETIVKDYAQIHGLVNNAYPNVLYQKLEDISWATWGEVAAIGLGLPLTLATELQQRKIGLQSIVNVSSMYGLVAPDFSMYSKGQNPSPIYYGAIKAGLIHQTRYLAVCWAEKKIRVNSVSPGGIFDNQDSEFLERYNKTVPMKRMVSREEVANTICFLLGEDSAGITGENIVIDAGRTII